MHTHENQIKIPASEYRRIDAGGPVSKARFVATLSDGTTAVEESGEWTTRYGERKPWVRLTQFAAKNGLHLTSLRLNVDGRTIHMPREKFDRFGLESVIPNFYSLSYQLEVDDIMNGSGHQSYFVSLTSHFDNFEVHYIQDVTNSNNSWVVVTQGHQPIAPTPRRK